MTDGHDTLEQRLLTMMETLAPPIDPDAVMAGTAAPAARGRAAAAPTRRLTARPARVAIPVLAASLAAVVILALTVANPGVLTVKSGAQNRAAQSDLTNAITSGKTAFTNHGNYGPSSQRAVAALQATEPELRFTTGRVTYDHNAHLLSVRVSRDGEILVLAGQAANGSCWYAEDNEESVPTADGLSSAASTQGISYASSGGARRTSCSAGDRVLDWGSTYPSS